MQIRTAEDLVMGSLTMALATFILVWHYGIGTPMPDYVLMTAAVPVVVAMFGVIRRRWVRGRRHEI